MCDASCLCDDCVASEEAEIDAYVWKRAQALFEKAAAANNARWDDLDDSLKREWFALASEG